MWRSTCFAWMDLNHIIKKKKKKMIDIQLFWERLLEKMCMWPSQKVIWDIINTPFLTLQLSNLRLLLSFSSSQTYVHSLLYYSFKFLWRTVYSKPPTIPFGIVTCTFSKWLYAVSGAVWNIAHCPNGQLSQCHLLNFWLVNFVLNRY